MDLERQLTKAELKIGRMILQLDRVEAENVALRAQLEALLQRNNDSQTAGEHPTDYPRSTVSAIAKVMPPKNETSTAEKHEVLGRKYADLQSSYATLQSEYDVCHQQIGEAYRRAEAAHSKAKNHKNAARKWKEYAERREKKKQAALTSVAIQSSSPAKGRQIDGVGIGEGYKTPYSYFAQSPEGHANTVQKNTTTFNLPSSPIPFHGAPQSDADTRRVTSSQTTAEPTQRHDDLAVSTEKCTSSDSEPVFLSARSLKRKRVRSAAAESPAVRTKQEHESSNAMIELYSDPPTADHSILPSIAERTSSDLDKVDESVMTPHRAKRVQDLRPRATSLEIKRQIPRLHRNGSSLSEGDVHDKPSLSERSRTSEHARKEANADVITRSARATRSDRCNALPLRQISVNIPLSSPHRDTALKVKPQFKGIGPGSHAKLLSEASDAYSQVSVQHGRVENIPTAETDGQLEDMLNEHPAERLPILLRKSQSGSLDDQDARNTTHPITPVSEVKRKSPIKRRSPSKKQFLRRDSPPSIDPCDEPLRCRDVKRLRLDDFKINPNYLGTDFAFADTLRSRDQRRCLPTCTKSDCCGGALVKVVAMGGSSLSGKSDEEALDAYIGPSWRGATDSADEAKRKQLILQAHAHCFANQHGKHRLAFERQSTPPGFWRTDFPTTQENEGDREEAQELEKQAIDNRYREAMCEGGRWVFRDEQRGGIKASALAAVIAG